MPENESKCVCCSCNSELAKTKFYKSYSNFYANSHLPICKECFGEKFKCYSSEYQSNKLAMQRMCMAFDVHFDEDLFDKCDTNDSTVLGNYFKRLNISQYKGKTFEDSLKSGFDFNGNRKLDRESRVAIVDKYGNEEDTDAQIKEEDILKWGVGLEPNDYSILNSHYKLLTSSNPQCDSNVEIFIIDLCYTKMQQMKAVRESRVDDYKKLSESYIKLFTQAGLKTVKDSNAIEDFTIGVTAETIEKYTPAEYYKNKNLYNDHDSLGNYIERFLLRPLKNLMQGSRERDIEFFVKDEEETYGFADDE